MHSRRADADWNPHYPIVLSICLFPISYKPFCFLYPVLFPASCMFLPFWPLLLSSRSQSGFPGRPGYDGSSHIAYIKQTTLVSNPGIYHRRDGARPIRGLFLSIPIRRHGKRRKKKMGYIKMIKGKGRNRRQGLFARQYGAVRFRENRREKCQLKKK